MLKDRAFSNEHAFSSPKGLAYLSDMAIHNHFKEDSQENGSDDMEFHIDEDMQKHILSNIYSKDAPSASTLKKKVISQPESTSDVLAVQKQFSEALSLEDEE